MSRNPGRFLESLSGLPSNDQPAPVRRGSILDARVFERYVPSPPTIHRLAGVKKRLESPVERSENFR
jgi:hypothetical protein